MDQRLCRTAGCIEPSEPGDTLCCTHLCYVLEVVAFIEGSAPGVDFDTARESWAIHLERDGITLLPNHITEQRVAETLAAYERDRRIDG